MTLLEACVYLELRGIPHDVSRHARHPSDWWIEILSSLPTAFPACCFLFTIRRSPNGMPYRRDFIRALINKGVIDHE